MSSLQGSHEAQTEDQLLIQRLSDNYADPALKKGKVMKSQHRVFDHDIELTGWKFNEWDYGKPNRIQLPTQARGLFTTGDKIVIRGYDKFFNVNELPTTKWDYICEKTIGPYELSLKENGCIIFISGLEDGHLVVCSKHSTGYRDDVKKNHAEYGYRKLKTQLDTLGIEHKKLGKMLFDLNVTAVLELCDDDFEEHVLKYSREDSGLYLHGLNFNSPVFKTYPMTKVHEFADSYGFKKVDYILEKDPQSLKLFLEGCAQTGTYNGREVEGFVIRCKLKDSEDDYFFKYKFEEPYLMYRQWREVTKDLIRGKSVAELKISKHKYQTFKYIEFILPLLRADEELRESFENAHGIIELRNRYLEHAGKKGFEIAFDQDDDAETIRKDLLSLSLSNLTVAEKKIKYVIIPVATIGCGKTTTAVALTHLFPSWTHIQNDDIPNPGAKTKLVKGALELLQDSPCCFVDRNNHQKRERLQLLNDFAKIADDTPFSTEYQLKFICLNFIPDKDNARDRLWLVTQDRVLNRGDNHQSIKVEQLGKGKVESIMKGFINRFQKVDHTKVPDSYFNAIIDLQESGTDSSLKNLKTVIDQIHRIYPDLIPVVPTKEQILESFQLALTYKTSGEKFVKDYPSKKQKKKQFRPAYFGVCLKDPEALIHKVEDLLLTSNCEKLKVMFQSLKQLNRIQSQFHVTLTHVATLKTQKDVYNNYTKTYFAKELEKMAEQEDCDSMTLPFESCTIKLEKICGTKELLCVEVSINLQLPYQKPTDKICSNKFPHFTLGTIDESVKPKTSNNVVESINEFHYGEEKGFYQLKWEDDVILQTEELELKAFR